MNANFTFSDNPDPCGSPLGSCIKHHWKFSSFKMGFVIGYGVFVALVIAVLIPYDIPPWMKLKIRSQMLKIRHKVLGSRRKMKIKLADQVTDLHARENLEGGKEILRLEKMVTRLPYTELRNATNNFSEKNMIGMGKMGIMFKATLPTGLLLAVKKLHSPQLLDERFLAELEILGAMRHINILPLVGFCIKLNQRLLVYKYMPNGSLYDCLHLVQDQVMDWPSRVKIAVGVARGLAWIHHGSYIRVIHLNVSSKSILVDQNFEPRLSNFEEAMLMIPSKSCSENAEFWEVAFVKEDVYSFGIVLLELITGEDSSRMTSAFSSNSYDGSSNEWVSHMLDRNCSTFHDLVDGSISGQGFDDEIYQFIEIASSCVHSVPDRRPTMLEVYKKIKDVGEKYSMINDSKPATDPEIAVANDREICRK